MRDFPQKEKESLANYCADIHRGYSRQHETTAPYDYFSFL